MIGPSSDSTVDFDDLSPRAKSLSPDEMQNVFGGCTERNDACTNSCECCDGLVCKAGGADWSELMGWMDARCK